MLRSERQALKNGVYKIFWKDGGGISLASVGRTHSGRVWLAPSNWTHEDSRTPCVATTQSWERVERVEAIMLEGDFTPVLTKMSASPPDEKDTTTHPDEDDVKLPKRGKSRVAGYVGFEDIGVDDD